MANLIIRRLSAIIILIVWTGISGPSDYRAFAFMRSVGYSANLAQEEASKPEVIRPQNLRNLEGRWRGKARIRQPGRPVLIGHAFAFVCSAGYGSFHILRRIINLDDGSRVHDSVAILESNGKEELLFKEYPSQRAEIMMHSSQTRYELIDKQNLPSKKHVLDVEGGQWHETWIEVINKEMQSIDMRLDLEPVGDSDEVRADAKNYAQNYYPICD